MREYNDYERFKQELREARPLFLTLVVLLCMIVFVRKCSAQTIEVNGALLLKDGVLRPSLGANASYPMNDAFSLAIDFDVAFGTSGHKTLIDNSNVVASLRTNITKLLGASTNIEYELRTGFGWGHTFGNLMTDHNFHTYVIGVKVSKRVCGIKVYASPLFCSRTYAEHIGFAPERNWVRFEFGVGYELTHKPRMPTNHKIAKTRK